MGELELFNKIIETVKEIAKPGDMPMAWIKGSDGKLIVSAFATEKESIKMALWTFMKTNNAEEVIFATEAWHIQRKPGDEKKMDGQVKDQPDRKECFIVCYFSKDKELIQQLPFTRKKKGKKEICEWEEAPSYMDMSSQHSKFNPYKMNHDDLEEITKKAEQEVVRANGKKEVHNMALNHKLVIYRHKGKAFFEGLDKHDNAFMSCKVVEDDEKFESSMKEAITLFKSVGAIK